MATFGFVLSLILIAAMVAASALSLSAYVVSYRRTLLFFPVLCLGYGIEQSIIAYREFVNSNLIFSLSSFPHMEDPYIRIVLGAIMLGALMNAAIEHYGVNANVLRWFPSAVFVVACLVICLIPEITELVKKYLIYTARQCFLAFVAAYCLAQYRKIPDGPVKERYIRRRVQFTFIALFALLTVVEDTYVMLIMDVSDINSPLIELLYRRNISETLLVLIGAVFLSYVSVRTLRSFGKTKGLDLKSIDKEEALAFFSDKYALTHREKEILLLIVEGHDNQRIASSLQLALGTVKTHIHHIFRKSGCASRDELVKKFWLEF